MLQGKFHIDKDGNAIDPKDSNKKYKEIEIKEKIKNPKQKTK